MSLDFSKRRHDREIIDDPEKLDRRQWAVILRELGLVNRWLGGTRAALRAIKPLVRELHLRRPGIPVEVVDFGCGSGDILSSLVLWAREEGCPLRAVGIDLNPEVCRIAREETLHLEEVEIVRGDVNHPCIKTRGCDLILCSAFLHHFTNEEIAELLMNLLGLSRSAVIMSDLHRHPLAYWGIRLLSGLCSRSEAIRHDGPLSVQRAFRRDDLKAILGAAGVNEARISWRWLFRYVMVIPARGSC